MTEPEPCTTCAVLDRPCPVCTVAATWERNKGAFISRRLAKVLWASEAEVAWRYRGHRVTSPSKTIRWPAAKFFAGFRRVKFIPPVSPTTAPIPLHKLRRALALDAPAPNSLSPAWTKIGERGNTVLFLREEAVTPMRKRTSKRKDPVK